MVDTWNRSRLEILNHITQFCLSHKWDETRTSPGYHAFVSDISDKPAQVGDLVAIKSAPVSKFYLGWLEEMDPGTASAFPRYLLRSIEDGTLCWWSNVGIDYMDREVLADYPNWRWTDRQYAFKDRWWHVCYRERDAYITLPMFPEFGEGFSVTLGTRTRFGLDSHRPTRTFDDWRKVTKAMMGQFYDECAADRKSAA